MTTATAVRVSNRTLPMSVSNMTFMLDKLGEDCSPLQFVRELTQNAIESVLKSSDKTGEIQWDVNWNHQSLTGHTKLAVIDNGIGMTGEEMVKYINKLSSSINEQRRDGNFGVGAKISALPKNHEGLVYLSWKDGKGYIIHLWRDPNTDEYGLKRMSHPDGKEEYWGYIDDALKPDLIKDHGTVVILLGSLEDENTMLPPKGTAMPSRWILRYLNTRYFEFPNRITVRAREGWEKGKSDRHSFLREVTGQRPFLDSNSSHHGVVKLTNAKAHWWILKEEADDDSGHYAPGGHAASLYQNELYEMSIGRAGVARLQSFGVIFGCSRVVLYIEPTTNDDLEFSANIARTQLLCNGEPLPWSEWAAEFRDNIPAAIAELMDEIGSKASSSDHKSAIKERLKKLRDLFKFSRYRPSASGNHRINRDDANAGGESAKGGRQGDGDNRPGGRGGRAGDIYSLFLALSDGEPAEEVNGNNSPDVVWISTLDGTRTSGDMEDRAGKYLPEQNRLLINADFRVFTDFVDRWVNKYSNVSGARPTIEQVVREWFEQQLIETVLGALALRQTGQWTVEELKQIWSEESLTAAVMPRYHIDFAVARALGSKLGTLKDQ